jgi:hypothetical protein
MTDVNKIDVTSPTGIMPGIQRYSPKYVRGGGGSFRNSAKTARGVWIR